MKEISIVLSYQRRIFIPPILPSNPEPPTSHITIFPSNPLLATFETPPAPVSNALNILSSALQCTLWYVIVFWWTVGRVVSSLAALALPLRSMFLNILNAEGSFSRLLVLLAVSSKLRPSFLSSVVNYQEVFTILDQIPWKEQVDSHVPQQQSRSHWSITTKGTGEEVCEH